MTSTSLDNNKVQELEDLIELAEKTSERIKVLEAKRIRFFIYFYMLYFFAISFCIIFTTRIIINVDYSKYLTYNIYNSIYLILISVVIFVLIVFTIFQSRIYFKIRRDIILEKIILAKLFELISYHKESVQKDLGVVAKIIYEMRLSRIEFATSNGNSNSKEDNFLTS